MFLPHWRSRKDGLLLEGCSICQPISVWASRTILAYPETNLEGLNHLSSASSFSPLLPWQLKSAFKLGGPGGSVVFFLNSPMKWNYSFCKISYERSAFQGKKAHGLFAAFCQPFQAASILPSNIFSEGLPSKPLMKSTTESFQTHFIGQMGMKWYEMVWR